MSGKSSEKVTIEINDENVIELMENGASTLNSPFPLLPKATPFISPIRTQQQQFDFSSLANLPNPNDVSSNNILMLPDPQTHKTIKNKYWLVQHERSLEQIYNQSKNLSGVYIDLYQKKRKQLYKYRIPVIFISALCGFLSISNYGCAPNFWTKYISLFVGILNVMTTVINLIEGHKKIDQTMHKALFAHNGFKRIANKIHIILLSPQNERDQDGYITVTNFHDKFQQILDDSPIRKNNDNIADIL